MKKKKFIPSKHKLAKQKQIYNEAIYYLSERLDKLFDNTIGNENTSSVKQQYEERHRDNNFNN